MKKRAKSRTTVELLLYLGIATFFFWPFVQLYHIQAIPILDSDRYQKAAVALTTILEEALALPFPDSPPPAIFKIIPGFEEEGITGCVEILPHPDYKGMMLYRAHVKWGMFFLRKTLTLEAMTSRSKP